MYDKDHMCHMFRSAKECLGSYVVDAVASTCNEVTIDMSRVTLDDEYARCMKIVVPYKY